MILFVAARISRALEQLVYASHGISIFLRTLEDCDQIHWGRSWVIGSCKCRCILRLPWNARAKRVTFDDRNENEIFFLWLRISIVKSLADLLKKQLILWARSRDLWWNSASLRGLRWASSTQVSRFCWHLTAEQGNLLWFLEEIRHDFSRNIFHHHLSWYWSSSTSLFSAFVLLFSFFFSWVYSFLLLFFFSY